MLSSSRLVRRRSNSRPYQEWKHARAYRVARTHCSNLNHVSLTCPVSGIGRVSIPEHAFNDLVYRIGAMLLVGEGVDVGSETRRGGCIDTGDMMVDAGLGAISISSPELRDSFRTCFVGFRMACFRRWTRSGGPSSRRPASDSVLASIDSCRISSVILVQGQLELGARRQRRLLTQAPLAQPWRRQLLSRIEKHC